MRVLKFYDNGYGRTHLPARGRITSTEAGRPRITPSATGIPAQCHVAWEDGEMTWEKLDAVSFSR